MDTNGKTLNKRGVRMRTGTLPSGAKYAARRMATGGKSITATTKKGEKTKSLSRITKDGVVRESRQNAKPAKTFGWPMEQKTKAQRLNTPKEAMRNIGGSKYNQNHGFQQKVTTKYSPPKPKASKAKRK